MLTQATGDTIFFYSHKNTNTAKPSAKEVFPFFEQSETRRTVVIMIMMLFAERWQHAQVTSSNTPPNQWRWLLTNVLHLSKFTWSVSRYHVHLLWLPRKWCDRHVYLTVQCKICNKLLSKNAKEKYSGLWS